MMMGRRMDVEWQLEMLGHNGGSIFVSVMVTVGPWSWVLQWFSYGSYDHNLVVVILVV